MTIRLEEDILLDNGRALRYPKWSEPLLRAIWSFHFIIACGSTLFALLTSVTFVRKLTNSNQVVLLSAVTLALVTNFVIIGCIGYEVTFLRTGKLARLSSKRLYFLQLFKCICIGILLFALVIASSVLSRTVMKGGYKHPLEYGWRNWVILLASPFWAAYAWTFALRWKAISQFEGRSRGERVMMMVWYLQKN